ncbi:MAG: hypothetical protein RJB58_2375 [Pseudomonadota bacterium]|jgi:hypothetical protein
MNRTDTLLRLKRFRVDEMKRRIASIDAMRCDLERKLADLDDMWLAKNSGPATAISAGWPSGPSCVRFNRAAKICAPRSRRSSANMLPRRWTFPTRSRI